MKKPVGRLLYPNTGWYFAAMLLFTAAAAAVGQYILAGGALFVTLIMFIISRARLSRRKRQLMSYVQTATDSVGISVHAGSAFPMAVIRLPENYGDLSPVLHVVPLQLLAYHTALARGTDVDKPRNLAKSVTTE